VDDDECGVGSDSAKLKEHVDLRMLMRHEKLSISNLNSLQKQDSSM